MKNSILVVLFIFMFLLITVEHIETDYLLHQFTQHENRLVEMSKQISVLNGQIIVDEKQLTEYKQAIGVLKQENDTIKEGIQELDYLMEVLNDSIKNYTYVKK